MKAKTIAILFGLGMTLATQTLLAYPNYPSQMPNGATFGCANCHINPAGGGPTNPFGTAFLNNNYTWNAALAALDSDGDGYSNGVELGDPNGTWTPGQPNPPGPVYNPGAATSHPGAPAATAPTIVTQPASQTVAEGANVTLTVSATGTAPLSYQWTLGGLNIPGATSATLTLNGVVVANSGSYAVEVSNSAGSVTSAAATLTVNPAPVATAPTITTHPASQTVTAGANVTFNVSATGTTPLSYQWMRAGASISGATAATLTLNAVTAANAGSYTVRVSNSAGSVTSAAATLTVNPAAVAPSIVTHPASHTVTAGAKVTFNVSATGTAPLSYQWMKGGASISGATAATLTLNAVTAANAGSYTVKVSNSAGSVTSTAATLTVNPAVTTLTITLDSPTNGTSFAAPADVTLAATVSPAQNVAGVEFFDGTNLLGVVKTAPYSMIASNLPAGDHVLITRATDNSGATAVSTPIDITVTALPVGGSPPVVKLLTPRTGTLFYSPAKIMIVVSVVDTNSAIKSVAFYSGTTLLGLGTPYTGGEADDGGGSVRSSSTMYYLVATGLPIGQDTLTAKAIAADGTTGTSAPVQIIVTTRPVRRYSDD